jgi:hypothetical protein
VPDNANAFHRIRQDLGLSHSLRVEGAEYRDVWFQFGEGGRDLVGTHFASQVEVGAFAYKMRKSAQVERVIAANQDSDYPEPFYSLFGCLRATSRDRSAGGTYLPAKRRGS